MSQLVSIDFSAALTTDFNGATSSFSVSGGTLTATGEGGILTKTSLGTGDKWVRVQLPVIGSVTGGDVGIALGDSSGNCIAWIVDRLDTGNLWIEAATEYSTYTTWVSDTTLGANVGSFSAGSYLGVTFEISANRIRVWSGVTAAAPDSVSSWDSVAADWNSTTKTFKANSNYTGILCWSGSGGGTDSYDNFTAGDFAAGGGTVTWVGYSG